MTNCCEVSLSNATPLECNAVIAAVSRIHYQSGFFKIAVRFLNLLSLIMDHDYVMGDETLEAWDAMLAEDKWRSDLQLSDATQNRIDQAENQCGGAVFNIADHLEIEPDGERHSPKYKLTFKQFKVHTRDLENVPLPEVPGVITSILAYVLDTVLLDVPGESYVRLRIENAILRYPIWTPPILKSQVTVERWMDLVSKVLQSWQTFDLGAGFEVAVHYTELPGGGCVRDVPKLLFNKLKNKRCIVRVKNADDICMARALVIGKAYADGDKKLYQKLNHDFPTLQTIEAKKLVRGAGLPERKFSIADIPAFETVSADDVSFRMR